MARFIWNGWGSRASREHKGADVRDGLQAGSGRRGLPGQDHPHRQDTRLSGDMLESAVASGIMSMGGTALLAGIIPTPAIALLVRELHCDGGIVISASHNPPGVQRHQAVRRPGLQAAGCG